MSHLEAVRLAARHRGVPMRRLWVDELTSMTFNPSESRQCAGMFHSFTKQFYPVLLRWEEDDGSQKAMRVDPVVGGTERHPRTDWIATGNRFLSDLTRSAP